MRTITLFFALSFLATALHAETFAIAIHGGAGTIERASLDEERETEIRAALEQAVRAGHAVLEAGGDSIDAVIAAIRIMEDAPQFNAGRGAVLTSEGKVEMDASLMSGKDLSAGAVAGVTGIRHPIEAARRVMTDTPHVMLAGRGAESFAREQGLEFEDEDWFITDFRRRQLEAIRAEQDASAQSCDQARKPLWEGLSSPDSRCSSLVGPGKGLPQKNPYSQWYSTVGAVALDKRGNLAAATSTGGMTNKRWGRIGDSPVIGAGTYADNRSCAVSATGHGEFFIRHVVAYDICARMTYTGKSLRETADEVVNGVLVNAGADGGVIAIDRQGNVTMPFNTPGMYRAAIHGDGRLEIGIFRDDG